MAPVDATVAAERLAAPLELLRESRMRGEPRRIGEELLVPAREVAGGDPGLDHGHRRFRLLGARRIIRGLFRRLERRLEPGGDPGVERLGLGRGHELLLHEARRPDLTRRRMRPHLLVQERLSEARLVPLVVPPAPVPDEVHEEVLPETRAIRDRDPHRDHARLGVIRVHVDDRHLEALRHVARVARRARIDRIGGEADLVVHDDVQRAAHAVRAEAREIHRLGDDPLAREGRIAVDADRHDARLVATAAVALRALERAGAPHEHGIHDLEVTRVRHERDVDRPVRRPVRAVVAEVVLHVPGGGAGQVTELPLELAEDQRDRLLQHMGEHTDAAAMRHRDRDMFRARGSRGVHGRVQHRHQGIRALDGESLVADEGAAEETLEPVHLREAAQHSPLLIRGQRSRESFLGEQLTEPGALLLTAEVPHLDREIGAVALAQAVGDVAGGGEVREPERGAGDQVEIGLGDAEEVEAEFGGTRRGRSQRIDLNREVTVVPDGRGVARGASGLPRVLGVRKDVRNDVRNGARCGCRGGRGGPHRLLGEAEELPPRFLDGRGVPTVGLELFGSVGVVEDARDRLVGHAGI